jgi:type IV secretion system protein TrbE
MLRLSEFRSKAQGTPDLLNWAALVDDNLVLGKDGSLIAGYFIRGDDSANLLSAQLNANSALVNRALKFLAFEAGWTVNIDALRTPTDAYLRRSQFPDAISRLIDEERRLFFTKQSKQYETIIALTFTYIPPSVQEGRVTDFFFDDLEKVADQRNKHIQHFRDRIYSVLAHLSTLVIIKPMASYPFEDEHKIMHLRSDLLRFLNFCIGGRSHPINIPPCPMYLDKLIGAYDLHTGLNLRLGDGFIGVISIEGFPSESYPAMLGILSKYNQKLRWSTRYIIIDRNSAINTLKKFRRKWQQKIHGFFDQVFRTQKGVVNQDGVW